MALDLLGDAAVIDIGERAVLSVLVQRGGKLPEWKKINGAFWFDLWPALGPVADVPALMPGDMAFDLRLVQKPPCLVRQFNSRTIADLAGRSLVRCRVDRVRRVRVVEITDAGRKALAAWRDPCQF